MALLLRPSRDHFFLGVSSFFKYFFGFLSKSFLQDLQQSLISWFSWVNTYGSPISPSFSSETMHVFSGYALGFCFAGTSAAWAANGPAANTRASSIEASVLCFISSVPVAQKNRGFQLERPVTGVDDRAIRRMARDATAAFVKKLFLLDGMALVYRAHFALIARPIFSSKGVNTSALYGFTQTLLDILSKQQPTHIAVAFDTEAPTQRHAEFAEYKATRQAMPEDLSQALPHVRRLLEAFRI